MDWINLMSGRNMARIMVPMATAMNIMVMGVRMLGRTRMRESACWSYMRVRVARVVERSPVWEESSMAAGTEAGRIEPAGQERAGAPLAMTSARWRDSL